MELLFDAEQKTKYEKCKYKVKYWEHQFKKKNGRLPSKLDIHEASNDIRYAYKTYFNLKSAALEASFQNIDGFDSDDDQENSSKSLNTPNISSIETSINNEGNITVNNTLISSEDKSPEEKIEKTLDPAINNELNNSTNLADNLSDSINSNKTWGSHLNKIVQETKISKPASLAASSNFTKKLFKSANASKRNLRKSLSFHHRKSETNLNSSEGNSFSFSQPSTSISTLSFDTSAASGSADINLNASALDSSSNSFNIMLNSDKLRVTKPVEPVKMNSLNVVQAVLDEQFTTVRNVDAGWMQRVAISSGTRMINKILSEGNFALSDQLNSNQQEADEDSDIIGDSDEEEEDSKLYFSKRRKLNDSSILSLSQTDLQSSQNKLENAEISQVSNVTNSKNIDSNQQQEVIIEKTKENVKITKENFELTQENVKLTQEIVKFTKENVEITKEIEENTKIRSNKIEKPRKTSKSKPKPPKTQNKAEESLRKSTRTRKTVISLDIDELNEERDPFANDEDDDPDFSLNPKDLKENDEEPEEKVTKVKKSIPTQKSKKSQPKNQRIQESEENQDDDDQKSYELEYSIKPRHITVPRESNIKNVIKKSQAKHKSTTQEPNKNAIKTPHEQKLEKLEQKIKSGNLNDNFVRINIEKKKFTRGKKSINFSKYKKNMWKQKKQSNALCGPDMDLGGCDGGQLTCFNCGHVGHFARKCPKQKGDNLLPLAAGEEEFCPFPTLEEASEMARGQLAVRSKRNDIEPKNDDDLTEHKMDDETDEVTNDIDTNSDDSHEENEESVAADDKNIFSDDDDADLLAATIKLEEHIKSIDRNQFIDDSTHIRPYYQTKEDGGLIDTPQEVFDVLQMFGHANFRPGQEKAIMRILSGKSTLVTLSTGSGKSLCYQIPAYLLTKREPCIALVISPLVSLMEDQVTGIPKFLRAECLHTNKTKLQRERILNAISTGDLHILLVSPEAVVAGEKKTGFGSLLRKLPPIAFACIDEAHCVSQWSHNFRPSYLMICSILKERLGVKTILGLTATATRATCDSIIDHLSIPDGRDGIISDIPLPDNLRLTVSKDGNRDAALVNLILSERFENLRSIIVYCTRRQECERIASILRTSLKHENGGIQGSAEEPVSEKGNKRKRTKLKVQAEPYHAGLPGSKRRSIQNSFMRGDLRIVVATVAFGMGINKSDIRAVIHYNLPKNFESYVQEVGRAGRDGLPAHCHLFLDAQGRDEDELQRHIFSDSLDRHVIRKLNSKIFVPCSCKGVCPKHEVAFPIEQIVQSLDIPEENISTLLCYLELHDKKYIEVLSPAYITCKIIAYGSANYIRKAAKDCPPLAMALAMFGKKDNEKDNVFEFPIIDVAAAMGWDSGICKFKLKNLEWTNENGVPKRSFLTVQFSDLGFRLLAPGNLTNEQLDEVLDSLHSRVQNQEHCALLQLRSLHHTVTACAEVTYRQCINEQTTEKEILLKKRIREYFDCAQPLSLYELKPKGCDEGLIANDCRAMINMYRDNTFTGRALARIFYGIPSPNYPAVIWGRCKFWRSHINADFHKIVQIAAKEILKHR